MGIGQQLDPKNHGGDSEQRFELTESMGENMTPKRFIYILVLTVVDLTTIACRSDEPNYDATSAEDVQRESREAVETAHDYLSEEMKPFVQASEQKIAEMEEKTTVWRAKVDDLSEDARASAREELAELEAKAMEARRQLKALKEKTGNATEDIKTGAEAAIEELQQAYDRAAARYQKTS